MWVIGLSLFGNNLQRNRVMFMGDDSCVCEQKNEALHRIFEGIMIKKHFSIWFLLFTSGLKNQQNGFKNICFLNFC